MLFQPGELKNLIKANKVLILNKISERRNKYQDKFRTYSILASKGRLDSNNAIGLLNQEFPEQQQTTLKTMNSLFPQ